ncbi:MAG: hypothetical protein HQK99_15925 [Nitrospirae bacterium]|nr:hypothetical protein [Nitrospirota bacterium]
MKRGLIHLLVMAAILIGFAFFGVHSGLRNAAVASDTVSYWLPYLTTDTTAPVYCVLSNMGTQVLNAGDNTSVEDNITYFQFTVKSNAAGNTSQNTGTAFGRVPAGRSALLSFSGQAVYLNGIAIFDLSNDTGTTGTSAYYGGKLDMSGAYTPGVTGLPSNGSSATGRSTFNCSTIGMSCYQGTTSPKRNLKGYTCSDSGLLNYWGVTGGVYSH